MAITENRFFHLSLTSPALGRLEEAERFFLSGNLNEALAAAQQAWREHPTEPDVFRVIAYIHMTRGEYPPAAQAAYQSVVLDEGNPASYATLAQVYLTFSMYDNAAETVDMARQRFSEDPALLVLAADLKFRTGHAEDAVALSRQALAITPQDGYVKALLGTHYLQKKRYYDAVTLLHDAVEVYPQRWDYLRDLGIADLHTGKYDNARKALARSYRLNSAELTTKQHLLYALRLTQPSGAWYWTISFFFFNRSVLGWLLQIIGISAALFGFFWGYGLLFRSPLEASQQFFGPLLLLCGGIGSVAITASGLSTRQRKGNKLDRYLRQYDDVRLG